MTEDNSRLTPPAEAEPRWQPLGTIDRRVVGVLAEKAKTTPDGYPMSLGAIRNACNQKSNRSPVMNLDSDNVEESLDRLRDLGAVGMIEGHGRVQKYRHYLYEWLGVDKVELAVMTELLLRGAQTEGELRGRAARMEPIRDLAELRPVLAALKSRGLVVPLTPEGRGHVVTHALYPAVELERIRAQHGHVPAAGVLVEGPAVRDDNSRGPEPSVAFDAPPAPATPAAAIEPEAVDALRREMVELRAQVAQLQSDLEELSDRQNRTEDDLRQLRDTLGG